MMSSDPQRRSPMQHLRKGGMHNAGTKGGLKIVFNYSSLEMRIYLANIQILLACSISFQIQGNGNTIILGK